MGFKDKLCLSLLIVISTVFICAGQNFLTIDSNRNDPRIKVTWCTISPEEQQKCLNFAMANERDRISVGYDYFKLECKQATSKDECIVWLDEGKATLTTLDAGEIFMGGRYRSLVPIAQEVLEGGYKFYYAVAVVKKGGVPDINSLYDLRGRKACFAGVQTFAGWVLPIHTLMREGGMDIIDCNNHVKTAIKYFGPSCAVNSLTDKYNPIGDNSDKLCQLCIGKIPGGRCTHTDPYAGYDGAFRCLLEVGDIAFLKHTTVPELASGQEFSAVSKDSFELFCKDGTRRPVDEFLSCNWGQVPTDAVATSSAVSFETRKKLQKFLEKAAVRYGAPLKSNSSIFNNNNNNNRNPYDNNYNEYNSNNPQYDQYGNRINRFKRQNFGNYGNQQGNLGNYGNQYGQEARTDNPYQNQNNYPFDRTTTSKYGNNPYDDPRNPFARDPYNINQEQYGVNIDPYDRNPVINGPTSSTPRNYNFVPIDGKNTTNVTYYEVFNLFESSPKYGIHANLLFQDAARGISSLAENSQTYKGFLDKSLEIIMGIRDCPVGRMTLCVTSDAEVEKCVKMKTALKAQLLKPDMDCYKGHSQIHCMQAIRAGSADVAVLDAGDVYTAGLNFDLVPFVSEVYNLEDAEYYVVAVAKESDPSTELTYLRGKNTCHGGINTAAGWIYPLAFLLSNGWIRPYGCNGIRAAAEYFTKSCVPGALSTEYNTGVPYDNMCDLCHGSSFRYCRRDASEDYYGHTGAFRCLVEGGGHVAFVKHTTVTENTGGKKREWWTRDNLNDDYELLCTDGTRKEINEYEKCNLGKVKANAIVTRGGYAYNLTQINAYINLFLYAQTFYGRKTTDEFSFSMFYSMPPYSDLIFQDATTQLKVIDADQRHYANYLGGDFMRAKRVVDCYAGATSVRISLFGLIIPAVFLVIVH